MKEELKTVLKDIEDLEARLRILREREDAIRSKIEVPSEWIGKYIKETSHIYEYYMRIDSISKTKNGNFIAEGPAVDVCHMLVGTRYTLYSHHNFSVNIDDELNFVTKEEFDAALENCLKNFK